MNARIKDYVSQILARLPARPPAVRAATEDPSAVADEIFSILTGREFCYLSRGRTAPYRETTTALLKRDIERGEPVRFYYDIGAGYHASIHPGESGLVFNVGFSELCVLAQIASFCNRVAGIYRAGARFVLVIDNLCGLVTNAIPVDDTLGYCSELRTLIEQTGMHDRVEVLVESEQFDAAGYAIDHGRLAADAAAMTPSEQDIENVRRFLGRSCDNTEARERMARYRQAGEMTERHLEGVVRGVRMTQRATGGTLGFRPFPGGDSRTQVGEVAITRNSRGVLHAMLLTSRNVQAYHCRRVRLPDLLPPVVRHVTVAEPQEEK